MLGRHGNVLFIIFSPYYSLHSSVHPPTVSPVTVAPPPAQRPHTHPPLVSLSNGVPAPSTASVVHSDSSSRQSSVFPWMMSEDSPPLSSQCPGVSDREEAVDQSTQSLTRRVCKKLSKAKQNANKLVHWLRQVQNV